MNRDHQLERSESAGAEKLILNGSSIRLGQALKFSGIAENGTSAKQMLEEGCIEVNGKQEQHRGRQLVDGDVISFLTSGKGNVDEKTSFIISMQ